MTPIESMKWVEERMVPVYPLDDFKVSDAVAALRVR